MSSRRLGGSALIKELGGVTSANALSLIVSFLAILVLPRYLSISDFGYFQLYLLIVSFAGFLHLGWADGLYLSLGGRPRRLAYSATVRGDFLRYLLVQIIFALGWGLLASLLVRTDERGIVWLSAAVSVLLANIRVYGYMAHQAVGNIGRYSRALVLDRLTFVIAAGVSLVATDAGFLGIIASDLLGRLVSAFYATSAWMARREARTGVARRRALSPWLISVGFPLMLANFVGQFILGSTRFMVDASMGIEDFAALSLALSLASLAAVFASAMSVPLFPRLRRLRPESVSSIYLTLRPALGAVLVLLTLSYPLVAVGLRLWLPQYAAGVAYLAVLFPVLLYQAEVLILFSTFLKVINRQKSLLVANVAALATSVLAGIVALALIRSVMWAAFSMLLASAVQARVAEQVLVTKMGLKPGWARWIEDLCLGVFLMANVVLALPWITVSWVAVSLGCAFALIRLSRAAGGAP